MKTLAGLIVCGMLLSMLSSCVYFRKENPLNIECSSCGYIWGRTPAKTDKPPVAK